MSKKYCGLQVTFENEISEEYLAVLKTMIMSFKGVISVNPIESDSEHNIAKYQAKHELILKIADLLKND